MYELFLALVIFLSTPSSQRATMHRRKSTRCRRNFYPRPLRRGRRCTGGDRRGAGAISIHALFAEGDAGGVMTAAPIQVFLSTPSSQRATFPGINIAICKEYFYPRPLRRGRRGRRPRHNTDSAFLSTPSSQRATFRIIDAYIDSKFLSTPSSQRATVGQHHAGDHDRISIHALFAEGDR